MIRFLAEVSVMEVQEGVKVGMRGRDLTWVGWRGSQNLVQGPCRVAVDTRPAAHANIFREYVDQCEVSRGNPQLYSRKCLHLNTQTSKSRNANRLPILKQSLMMKTIFWRPGNRRR